MKISLLGGNCSFRVVFIGEEVGIERRVERFIESFLLGRIS